MIGWLSRCQITVFCFFFFQAEDGIRDADVTEVQTCALPIFGTSENARQNEKVLGSADHSIFEIQRLGHSPCRIKGFGRRRRSEERRVGKEWRSRWGRE